ncbi:MAG: tandem-95 repeat protein [bacterium]|nr:tandem-95 repeat protein [bacterium]
MGDFTFLVNDGTVNSSSATITVNVTSVNGIPTLSAISDPSSILEDASAQTVNLSGIGTGASNESQTLTVTATSSNTSLIPNPTVTYTSANTTGTLTYTPVANESGTATITVTVTDDGGTANGGVNTVSQTFSVTVTTVNDIPTLSAISDPTAILEDASAQTINLSGIGTGASNESQTLTVSATSSNTSLIPNPTVTYTSPNTTGTLTYTPLANANGTATITATVTDDGGTSNGGVNTVSQTFTVTVTPVEDPPTANNDDFTIDEDTPSLLDVTANDSDPDGDAITVISVTNVTGGVATPSGGTQVNFAPHFEFSGSGEFTYTISDTKGNTATAGVSVNVTAINDPPIANNDNGTTNQDQAVTIEVLSNDSDVEGNALSVSSVGSPDNGSTTIKGQNVVYTPNVGFFGEDSFSYTVSDGEKESTANGKVTIIRANTAPQAIDDAITLAVGASINIMVRDNDTDQDGDPLIVSAIGNAQNGQVVINTDGTVFYRPNGGFNGTDSFTYTVNDGHGGMSTATVTVTVQAPPGTPTAGNDQVTTAEDTSVDIEVLLNDSDGGSGPNLITSATDGTNGATIVTADGKVTYSPKLNFNGQDQFTYTIRNAEDKTASATVTVTVTPVNDPPLVSAIPLQQGVENTVFELDLSPFVSDPDNTLNELTYEVVSVAVPVASAEVQGHQLKTTPGGQQHGEGSVTLAVKDLAGGRTEVEVKIAFKEVNDPPTLEAFSPIDGAIDVPRSVVMTWQGQDPDNKDLKYSVRLGMVSNVLNTKGRDLSEPRFAFQARFGETWFWQVLVTDGTNTVEGPLSTFTVVKDTRAPVLSRVDAVDIGTESARIVWQSDEDATTEVVFGKKADLSDGTSVQGTASKQAVVLGRSHSTKLAPLTEKNLYYYRAISKDAAGNTGESDVQSFATLKAPDIKPPAFLLALAEGVTDRSVSVRWSTDERAIGVATLTGNGETREATASIPALEQVVSFDQLKASTPYTVKVTAQDPAGNKTVSDPVTFITTATPDIIPPIFARRPEVVVTHISARISWEVNEPAKGEVKYGLQLDALTESVTTGPGVALSVELGGLASDLDYVFEVISTDLAGNELKATGVLKTLKLPDKKAPEVVEGPGAQGITQTQATVSWKSDEGAFSRVIYDSPDLSAASPSTPLTGSPALDHAHRLIGLEAGKAYKYKVVNIDAAGNKSISGENTFTTKIAPDLTPPVLTAQPVYTNIGADGFTVEWGTGEASTSEVEATPMSTPIQPVGALLVVDPLHAIFHRVTVLGAKASTNYTVKIRSKDAAGNLLERSLSDVLTLAVPDKIAPQITGPPVVLSATDNKAQIVWTTNELADQFVDVDTLADFSTVRTFGSTTPSLDHNVTATGLKGGTLHYYRVRSTDVKGNGPTGWPEAGKTLTFSTLKAPDKTPPFLVWGPVAVSVQQTSVQIQWALSEPSDGRVRYALSQADLSDVQSAFEATLKQVHEIDLTGLEADSTYFYQVLSFDGAKNGPLISAVKTFRTLALPDRVAPVVTSGPTALDVKPTSALIAFTTNEAANTEVEMNSVLTSRSEAVLYHQVQVTGLTPETEYTLTVHSTDAAGNRVSKSGGRVRTPGVPDNSPPVILEGPSITYASDIQATVTWISDEPATSKVVFGPVDRFLTDPDPPVTSPLLVTSHNVAVTGLTKGTRYFFRIESADGSGNTVVAGTLQGFVAKPGVVTKLVQPPGGDGSFFTALQPDTQLPVILKGPHVISSSSTSLTIEWDTDESSDSVVRFGEDGLTSRLEQGQDVLTHRMVLTNLSPATSYQYQVASTDPADNGETVSRIALTKTALAVDETPPQIVAAPEVIYKTERSATISWGTDEGAGTFLVFGTGALDNQKAAPDFVTAHQVSLTNLLPETTYRYLVRATDAAGNGPTVSEAFTFITDAAPDRTPPELVEMPEAVALTDVSAQIRWTTNELSDSAVKYGEDLGAEALGLVTGSAKDVLTHEVALTNLKAATAYSFQIESIDRSGNGPTRSPILTFQTQAGKDETPPGVPQEVVARGALGEVVLTWTLSPEADVAGYDILRATGDGDLAPFVTLVPGPPYRDDGLDASLTYRYAVLAVDAASNTSDPSPTTSAIPDGSGLPTAPQSLTREGDLLQPLLVVQNAKSPVSLTYVFQVALDEAFEQIVTQILEIIQGAGTNQEDATAWQIDRALEDGITYYWRARAFDGIFTGPFMVPESFVAGQLPFNPGDFDNDGKVGFPDFVLFANAFGSDQTEDVYRPEFDFDDNGEIGFPDFIRFADLFGTVYEQ